MKEANSCFGNANGQCWLVKSATFWFPAADETPEFEDAVTWNKFEAIILRWRGHDITDISHVVMSINSNGMQIKSGPPSIAKWIDISLPFSASSFTEIKWVAYLKIHPKVILYSIKEYLECVYGR